MKTSDDQSIPSKEFGQIFNLSSDILSKYLDYQVSRSSFQILSFQT
jgi:hypothetical protein